MLIRYLKNLLAALFNLRAPSASLPVTLVARSAARLPVALGADEPLAVQVAAFEPGEARAATGRKVRFTVLRGPALFADHSTTVVASTNSEGTATAQLRMTEAGSAVVAAALDDGSAIAASFRVVTDTMPWQIELWSEPAVSAEAGVITVRIAAFDFLGEPATGGQFSIEATSRIDTVITGTVTELGHGEYVGTLQTQLAGQWQITVYDENSGTRATRYVHVLPGEAERFELGRIDPRVAPPRNVLPLDVRLVDKFGNALDPKRIELTASAGDWTRLLHGDSARFTIRFDGLGVVPIELRDSASPVSKSEELRFHAVHLEDPGLVQVGARYGIGAHAFLPADRPVSDIRIEIRFNPALVRFAELQNADSLQTGIAIEAALASPDLLAISIKSTQPLHQRELPNGLYIGKTVWECTGEGETCFDSTAHMSPAHPGLGLCFLQKQIKTKHVCINVIYPSHDLNAVVAAQTVVASIDQIFNSHAVLGRCCPAIRLRVHYCPISPANWGAVISATGDGSVDNEAEYFRVADLGFCYRPKCFNIWMLRLRNGALGITGRGIHRDRAVVDPDSIRSEVKAGAHEFGHALGLGHLPAHWLDPHNLMVPGAPVGHLLSPEQCDTVWRNIDRFAG